MKIAIDMDNTIIDELGSTLRPGIVDFLEKMKINHTLILWTNSKRIRAFEIMNYFDLRPYFTRIITRDDYDPQDEGLKKDLSLYKYDMLIDDDTEEIAYTRKKGKIGILVASYRKNSPVDPQELEKIIRKYQGKNLRRRLSDFLEAPIFGRFPGRS